MNSITNFLLGVLLVLLILNLTVLYKQRNNIENAREQIKMTIEESLAVKRDLENLMAVALQLSDQIVTDIQSQASKSKSILSPENSLNSEEKPSQAFMEYCNNIINATISEVDLSSELNNEATFDQIKTNTVETIQNQFGQSDIHHEVVRLYEQGLSINEIARRTNRGQGEISLILNLKQKRNVM